MSRLRIMLLLMALALFSLARTAMADTTDSTSYGSGNYGSCDYGSCAITLTSSGSVSLDVSPTGAGVCSVGSGTASVLTNNDAGYTLKLSNSTTDTFMTNGGDTIPASSATPASPTMLAANTWGFRVDGLGGFGAGPTSGGTNISTPLVTFAKVPASNVTAATLATTSAAANPAVVTTVWYGLCVDTLTPSGTYSSQVTYTAVTN